MFFFLLLAPLGATQLIGNAPDEIGFFADIYWIINPKVHRSSARESFEILLYPYASYHIGFSIYAKFLAMQFSYSLILPYFIQVYLISPKFIMVSYERFTDSPLSTGTGNLFLDSSTHAPCSIQTTVFAGKAFRFFPEPSSRAVDNSLCEIIFARKEEE